MYGERNNDARSCNHCCRGKSIRVTYSEYELVALGIQHAMRKPHIIMWPARLYGIYPHCLIKGTISGKKVNEHKLCFDLLYNFCTKHSSF